jgi:hypothetical protein
MATGGGGVGVLLYVCTDWDEATFQKTMDRGKAAMQSPQDVPGVGRMAYASGGGMAQLQFWDDDTSCYGTFSGTVKDLPGLAGEAAKALTPDTIK